MENEKEFDAQTMTRATHWDVQRMYKRLWGHTPLISVMAMKNPKVEYLDLTQEFDLHWYGDTDIMKRMA